MCKEHLSRYFFKRNLPIDEKVQSKFDQSVGFLDALLTDKKSVASLLKWQRRDSERFMEERQRQEEIGFSLMQELHRLAEKLQKGS